MVNRIYIVCSCLGATVELPIFSGLSVYLHLSTTWFGFIWKQLQSVILQVSMVTDLAVVWGGMVPLLVNFLDPLLLLEPWKRLITKIKWLFLRHVTDVLCCIWTNCFGKSSVNVANMSCIGQFFCTSTSKYKQENPPAWTQEAYRPPRSKCLLCWSV